MSIVVERAKTNNEKNNCFKVRYDVFFKETGYIQKQNELGIEADDFDELDTTYHFLARYNNELAGAARLVMPNMDVAKTKKNYFGLPIEELFDIEHYKRKKIRIAEISRSSVKHKYRRTRTIFYLWQELIRFAQSKGITHLVTNVNPETDKLSDAYLVYDLIKSNGLIDRQISVTPKRPGIGKVRSFRFPLTDSSCCDHSSDQDGLVKINMPPTLKLFSRVGIMFTGEPVYCEKIDMCAMPMDWALKDIEKNFFSKFNKKPAAVQKYH